MWGALDPSARSDPVPRQVGAVVAQHPADDARGALAGRRGDVAVRGHPTLRDRPHRRSDALVARLVHGVESSTSTRVAGTPGSVIVGAFLTLDVSVAPTLARHAHLRAGAVGGSW